MLSSAADHYDRQQSIAAQALQAARRYQRTDTVSIAQSVALFQAAAAQDALDSIDPMLTEQGLSAPPIGLMTATSFAGTASDGRPLVTLLEQARDAFALGLMVVTQVQDAGRAASAVSIAARPRLGYVRMISPGACSRCAILAGKFFRYNTGFLRHPHCSCRHVPSIENVAGDLTTDPQGYFAALSREEQDRVFTKSGAEAIRRGADINQVVNARRVTAGMQVAGGSRTTTRVIGGVERVVNVSTTSPVRRAFENAYTTEGSTVRSLAYAQQLGLRSNGTVQQRLMPEAILDGSRSRTEAQRLLKLYGYIRDDAAVSSGRVTLAERQRAQRILRARQRRADLRAAIRTAELQRTAEADLQLQIPADA